MQVLLSQSQSLSTKPGIYLFLDGRNKILYVGKAKNLKKRVASYFASDVELGTKTKALVSKVKRIETIVLNSEIEAFLLENHYIKKHKPKYNIKLTDDKAYPLIRISIKDSYPKVLIARKANDKNSIYFGPFPNAAGSLRLTLKTIRKIFPYQSVPNHAKKICLYYHLGLCPCPPIFQSNEFKKEYKKKIKHIIYFLNGNTKKIIRELTKERNIYSKNENFEKAAEIQKKIDAIKLITDSVYNQFDYKVNPNLTQDTLDNQLSSLRYLLSQNGIHVEKLERIECYDISDTSGTNATGSMAVFINGEKDSSSYRKFRIRTLDSPNDFAMMEEVLQRRMKHNEWPMPDLIIVDGGKGQVSAALKAMKQFNNLTIPVIGLAKREEIIITSDFKEIFLPKDSEALKLIMRIRDEAHRFAITYHRKLRSKNLLN